MDFKILAVLLFAFAAVEASVLSDFLRPVAYAALSDVAESDWDEASSVVQKEEEDEDTELVEEEAGKELVTYSAVLINSNLHKRLLQIHPILLHTAE